MISKQTAEPFTWCNACKAWTLLSTSTLHVMQERMPPGTLELRHVHEQVRQFYFVLAGTAAVEVDGRTELSAQGKESRSNLKRFINCETTRPIHSSSW
jgi:uncharacterized cupin superfamily protein